MAGTTQHGTSGDGGAPVWARQHGRRSALSREAIVEAVRFRQAMVRLAVRIRRDGTRPDWFFGVWQPPHVTDPRTGGTVAFEDAD